MVKLPCGSNENIEKCVRDRDHPEKRLQSQSTLTKLVHMVIFLTKNTMGEICARWALYMLQTVFLHYFTLIKKLIVEE